MSVLPGAARDTDCKPLDVVVEPADEPIDDPLAVEVDAAAGEVATLAGVPPAEVVGGVAVRPRDAAAEIAANTSSGVSAESS